MQCTASLQIVTPLPRKDPCFLLSACLQVALQGKDHQDIGPCIAPFWCSKAQAARWEYAYASKSGHWQSHGPRRASIVQCVQYFQVSLSSSCTSVLRCFSYTGLRLAVQRCLCDAAFLHQQGATAQVSHSSAVVTAQPQRCKVHCVTPWWLRRNLQSQALYTSVR